METDSKNGENMPIGFTVLDLNSLANTIRHCQTGNNYLNNGYTDVNGKFNKTIAL